MSTHPYWIIQSGSPKAAAPTIRDALRLSLKYRTQTTGCYIEYHPTGCALGNHLATAYTQERSQQ